MLSTERILRLTFKIQVVIHGTLHQLITSSGYVVSNGRLAFSTTWALVSSEVTLVAILLKTCRGNQMNGDFHDLESTRE